MWTFRKCFLDQFAKKLHIASVLFHKAGTSVKFRRLFNCPIRVLIDTQTNIHDDIYPLLDLNSVYGDRRNVWPPCLFTWDKGQSIIKAVSVL